MTLDTFYIKKAKDELRETDERKRQSIEQFRDWLSKHPFLNSIRKGDSVAITYVVLLSSATKR